MSDLPLDLEYGKVVGRFVLAVVDGPDVGEEPDGIPATGTVLISPKATSIKAENPLTTVIPKTIVCGINTDGVIVSPNNTPGVWLLAGVYKVSYYIDGVTIPEHDIQVVAGHTELNPLDLTNYIPPGGAAITQSEFSVLSNRLDAVAYNIHPVETDASFTVTADHLYGLIMCSNLAPVIATVPAGLFSKGDWFWFQSIGDNGMSIETTGLTLNGLSPITSCAPNGFILVVFTDPDTISVSSS